MNNITTNPYAKLFGYTSIALIFSLIGFVFGKMFIPPEFLVFANMFIMIFFIISAIASLCLKKGNKRFWTMKKTYLFAFLDGICIYPIVNYYAYSLGIDTVISVFIGTIAILAILALYGKSKNGDKVLKLGPILSIILIVLVIILFANIFIMSNTINIFTSILAILLFSVYIVYDVNRFKHSLRYIDTDCADDYACFVINIYTDFINLFLNILKFLDSKE